MGCSTSLILPLTEKPYEDIRFLQSSMRNIDRYFHHLHDSIHLKQATDEIIHLRDGVENYVRSLLKLIGLKDSRFDVKNEDLLKVGSFYEGTKLGTADQFDYIVVLSEFDADTIMIEDLNQPFNGINVKVYTERKKNKQFAERWNDIIEHSYVIGQNTNDIKKLGMLDIIFKHLRKVAVFQSPVHTKFGTIQLDSPEDICKDGPSVRLPLTLTKSWHVVEEMKRVDKTSTESIVVNITPAIRCKDIQEFIFPHDPLNPSIYNHVTETGSFLVIPASDGHFKKVFTETEVQLVKELPARHLKAFRVLKYLINGYQRLQYVSEFRKYCFSLYDSFAIKMLVIESSETCPCMTYTEYELFDCVFHVLQKIFISLYDTRDARYKIYPNIYIQSASIETNNSEIVNLITSAIMLRNRRRIRKYPMFYDCDIVRLNRSSLSDLIKHDLKVWIGEKERYDFSGNIKRYGVDPLNLKILHTLMALNQ